MRKYLQVLLVFAILLSIASVASAQIVLAELYVAPNGTYMFNYPSGWEIISEEDSRVTLTGFYEGDELLMTVYPPYNFDISTKSTFALITDLELDPDFSNVEEISFGRMNAVRADIDFDGVPSLGLWGVLDEGVFAPIFVTSGGDVEDALPLLGEIIASYRDAVPEHLLLELVHLERYAASWDGAVDELESLGLIGRGGNLVLQENYLYLVMRNSNNATLMPLGEYRQRANVVISAELTLEGSGGCSLFARIPNTGMNRINSYLEVAMIDELGLMYLDTNSEEEIFRAYPLDTMNMSNGHHLLLIVQDTTMSIFVDGALIAHQVPVERGNGMFAFGVVDPVPGTRCEAHNLWVHEAPIFTPGLCQIFAANTINRRSGPGTDYDRAGTMSAGSSLRAINSDRGSDGYLWYELEDNTWVREDIIQANGDCANLSPMR